MSELYCSEVLISRGVPFKETVSILLLEHFTDSFQCSVTKYRSIVWTMKQLSVRLYLYHISNAFFKESTVCENFLGTLKAVRIRE